MFPSIQGALEVDDFYNTSGAFNLTKHVSVFLYDSWMLQLCCYLGIKLDCVLYTLNLYVHLYIYIYIYIHIYILHIEFAHVQRTLYNVRMFDVHETLSSHWDFSFNFPSNTRNLELDQAHTLDLHPSLLLGSRLYSLCRSRSCCSTNRLLLFVLFVRVAAPWLVLSSVFSLLSLADV